MYLCQKKYIIDLLKRFKMDGASSCPTPMSTGKQLMTNEENLTDNLSLFRSAMGALQYLTNTRPDIYYSVNKLS